jgi:hypothetical protein
VTTSSKAAPSAAPAVGVLPRGRKRNRISTVSPAATSLRYQHATLVPTPAGLTVSAPAMTWSLMPSFGYRGPSMAPYIRAVFVSLSQNSSSGASPPGPSPASSSRSPNSGWSISTVAPLPARSSGASMPSPHDHVLRNQAVGRMWIVSASGPALVTRTVMSTSVGPALV